jgi:hypothetical protein
MSNLPTVAPDTRARQIRFTILVTLISIATITLVLIVGTRNSTANNPPGSPFSGQGSPVGGSPFSGQGSPVGMIMLTRAAAPGGTDITSQTATSATFTGTASKVTAAEAKTLGLTLSGCSGTYWTWRGHFRRVEAGILWYEFGPINYWCPDNKGHVIKWGWLNKLGIYGGVYSWVSSSGNTRSHTPFGYPSVHVFDRWHFHLTKVNDDRYPSVDYDLFANSGVSGTVYYG